MDIIWQKNSDDRFWSELSGFAGMLDNWFVNIDLKSEEEGQKIAITEIGYEVDPSSSTNLFHCPNCNGDRFAILEGVYEGNPTVGLACEECESYGAVFPCGL